MRRRQAAQRKHWWCARRSTAQVNACCGVRSVAHHCQQLCASHRAHACEFEALRRAAQRSTAVCMHAGGAQVAGDAMWACMREVHGGRRLHRYSADPTNRNCGDGDAVTAQIEGSGNELPRIQEPDQDGDAICAPQPRALRHLRRSPVPLFGPCCVLSAPGSPRQSRRHLLEGFLQSAEHSQLRPAGVV